MQDPSYAYELFLRAAQLGYSPSQFKLGHVFEYGLMNFQASPRRSLAWYTKAAEQGDPDAGFYDFPYNNAKNWRFLAGI